MALTTQTMTDEQRKSVAIEYLKAFDNGGVTSTGGSILDLFADDAQVYFPKWGLANGKEQIGQMLRRRRRNAEVDRPPLLALQLDLLGQRRRGVRGHQPRRAQGRTVARRRSRMGGGPLVRRLRDPRLEDPALLHLPRPGLRRQGHGPLSVAEGQGEIRPAGARDARRTTRPTIREEAHEFVSTTWQNWALPGLAGSRASRFPPARRRRGDGRRA